MSFLTPTRKGKELFIGINKEKEIKQYIMSANSPLIEGNIRYKERVCEKYATGYLVYVKSTDVDIKGINKQLKSHIYCGYDGLFQLFGNKEDDIEKINEKGETTDLDIIYYCFRSIIDARFVMKYLHNLFPHEQCKIAKFLLNKEAATLINVDNILGSHDK